VYSGFHKFHLWSWAAKGEAVVQQIGKQQKLASESSGSVLIFHLPFLDRCDPQLG